MLVEHDVECRAARASLRYAQEVECGDPRDRHPEHVLQPIEVLVRLRKLCTGIREHVLEWQLRVRSVTGKPRVRCCLCLPRVERRALRQRRPSPSRRGAISSVLCLVGSCRVSLYVSCLITIRFEHPFQRCNPRPHKRCHALRVAHRRRERCLRCVVGIPEAAGGTDRRSYPANGRCPVAAGWNSVLARKTLWRVAPVDRVSRDGSQHRLVSDSEIGSVPA